MFDPHFAKDYSAGKPKKPLKSDEADWSSLFVGLAVATAVAQYAVMWFLPQPELEKLFPLLCPLTCVAAVLYILFKRQPGLSFAALGVASSAASFFLSPLGAAGVYALERLTHPDRHPGELT